MSNVRDFTGVAADPETPHAGVAVLADGSTKKEKFAYVAGHTKDAQFSYTVHRSAPAAGERSMTEQTDHGSEAILPDGSSEAKVSLKAERVLRTTVERLEAIAKLEKEANPNANPPDTGLVMANLARGVWLEVGLDSDGPISPGRDLAIDRPMQSAPLAMIMDEFTEPHFTICRMQMKEPRRFGPHMRRGQRVFRLIVKNTSAEPRAFRGWAIVQES